MVRPAPAGVQARWQSHIGSRAERDRRRYLLLRSPWGGTEATAGHLDATVHAWAVSGWRPMALEDADGTFAMEIGTFKTYDAGFGVLS